ncbi:MAG: DUF2345 domain-containing protein, partial [Clostridiales bacterium]|nr:DUF2345 domain-containing protein [Clostridiales bacterium]
YGREIKMDKDEILISTVDDTTFVRIHKDNGAGGGSLGIEVITPNRVLISSESKINIESEDDMTITTNKKLYIQAKDSITMVSGGNVMEFDELTKKGISVATDTEFKLQSGFNSTVKSGKELSVSSDEDMKLTSGDKLIGKADKKIQLSSGGSSVTLGSSGMDLKASEIRQN